ncbi:16S rRNA methyltransferase [Candidatus Geothermarchaeota archaeon]|nr:MAG: 16S rRNA methyltransferase [Candidatus Geothermarchaeota archaeon]
MTLYHVILAESSLELVPKELWGHSAVIKTAKRRKKTPKEILLDVSLHYAAMKGLKNREKRGRPDIVHITLLEILGSPLNIEGMLRVYVHTINDYVLFIRSDTRIPKNYNRFVGLMEQLFIEGRVPPNSETPLIYLKTIKLGDLLKNIRVDRVILLSEEGERKKPREIALELSKYNNPAIIIGGFPHGDFSKETYALADDIYSIYPKALEAWIVASRIISAIEDIMGIC